MDYSRQEKVIGKESQGKLRKSTVAIVGLGALGSCSAELLVRAGVGKLIIFDRDYVELSNLQRQHLFVKKDIGKPKAEIVEKRLNKITTDCKVDSYFDNLDHTNIKLLKKADLILDCTDNLHTRFLINEFSIENEIPWVYGAVIRGNGYVYNSVPKGPCFRCFVSETVGLDTCETAGVLGTASTFISAVQSNEALKILLDRKYEKDLLHFNLLNNDFDKIKVSKNKKCPACKGKFIYLNGENGNYIDSLCGGSYLFYGKFDLKSLRKKFKKKVIDFGENFNYDGLVTFFRDKVLIKAESEKEAKILFSKYVGD
jgi:molybdopterin/thiamine biosynthesis adenylyltransferase